MGGECVCSHTLTPTHARTHTHLASCWARRSLNLPLIMRVEQGGLRFREWLRTRTRPLVCTSQRARVEKKKAKKGGHVQRDCRLIRTNWATWHLLYAELDFDRATDMFSLAFRKLICQLKISTKVLVKHNYQPVNWRETSAHTLYLCCQIRNGCRRAWSCSTDSNKERFLLEWRMLR